MNGNLIFYIFNIPHPPLSTDELKVESLRMIFCFVFV